MMCTTVLKKAGLFAVLMSVIASSFAIESGDIENRVGFVDELTGAKVEAIERSEQSGEYRVLISLPGKDESESIEIEEVLVSAPSLTPDMQSLPKKTRYEFVNDYSADRYGLYIYIGKSKDWPFRIYFKDHDSELLDAQSMP